MIGLVVIRNWTWHEGFCCDILILDCEVRGKMLGVQRILS